MKNLTGGNYHVILPTLAKTARALAGLHLNHAQRRERMETLNRMIETQTKHNMAMESVYLEWLYVLHLILWATVYEDLTHTQVKGALYYFAEMCDAALAELSAPKDGALL